MKHLLNTNGCDIGILPHEEWRGIVLDGPFVWHFYEAVLP